MASVDAKSRCTVHVLLFSVLREKVGRPMIDFGLGGPATGADLLDALVDEYPVLRPYRSVIRLAVNESYVAEHITLAEGDEVALITPVSGG
jgi:molybdopterin converting factor small subunit